MACNWHVITCHYMHYMPLHAIEDANGLQSTSRSGQAIRIIARGQVQGALKILSPGAAGPQVPGPAIN